MIAIVLCGLTTLALLASWLIDKDRTRSALKISRKSLVELAPRVLGLVAIVGLMLALVPPAVLARLFNIHGIAGFTVVSVIGSIITMPGPIAFPLAGTLLKLGAAPATLAAFVTTLTMVGTVSAPIEVSYFGTRFTIVRQSLSFLTAIIIGLLMGEFL